MTTTNRNTEKTRKTMTPKELLEKAKKTIQEKGWTQGAYKRGPNAEGGFCMYGAIYEAAGVMTSSDGPDIIPTGKLADSIHAARNALVRAVGNPIAYNDAAGRTKDQVLEVFDDAIARAS
jgi:hypothetical protein